MTLDVSIWEIIKEIGHDGSEIVWPQFPEPLCRRGFHIQELILIAFYRGKSVTPFEALPMLQSGNGEPISVDLKMPPKSRLGYIMHGMLGVITGATIRGTPHAVAWDGEIILDSNGSKYPVEEFLLETFWCIR